MSWPFFTSTRYVAREGRVRHDAPPKKTQKTNAFVHCHCHAAKNMSNAQFHVDILPVKQFVGERYTTFVHSLCPFQPRSAHVPPISGVADQQPPQGFPYGLAKHALCWACCKHASYKCFDVCATTPPPIPSREPQIWWGPCSNMSNSKPATYHKKRPAHI